MMMIRRLADAVGIGTTGRQPSPVSELDVARVYQLLFGRAPESEQVVAEHAAAHADVWALMSSLFESKEFAERATGFRVMTTLDWRALLNRFHQPNLQPRPGFVTDFLGLHTRRPGMSTLWLAEGHLEGKPGTASTYYTASEWTACLRGVELASEDFVAVELGAGWGAWMAALCRAARLRGAWRTRAVGCEADELHCQMLEEHLRENGFSKQDYRLFKGAVGPTTGLALFPVCDDSRHDWGLRPVFCQSAREADQIAASQREDYRGFPVQDYHRVRCFTLPEIISHLDHVDVLHVDIQGGELELVEQNLELLGRKVGYLVIGTHSRLIEGRLIELLSQSGWRLEVEETCTFDLTHRQFQPNRDGVQGWRNLTLRPIDGDEC